MISQICDVLRISLASDTPSLTSLLEEITVIEKHLAIQQIRIGPKLSSISIDTDVLQAQVPVKILQPLIEELHARTGAVHLLRETMSALEERLDPAKFIRIHRSRIVRREQVTEVISEDNGDYVIKLRDGSEHRCSRTYSRMLTDWLQSGRA